MSAYRELFSDYSNLEERDFSKLHLIILGLDGQDLNTYLQGCSRTIIDQCDNQGLTALHWAVRRGDLTNVESLLRHGANPNVVSRTGYNSLHYAAYKSVVGIIDLLLSYGVDTEHCNSYLATPLPTVCSYRGHDTACVKRLIEGGARINTWDNQGATALMWASQQNSASSLQYLLENGAAINLQTFSGETALTIAVQHNAHEVIPILITHGADLTHHTVSGRSLLHEAAETGDEETLVILTSVGICGIEVNRKAKDGAMAWELARKRAYASPEWRTAFANLVASINQRVPESAKDSSEFHSCGSKNSMKGSSFPLVRLSDLIRVIEDSVYQRAVQANDCLRPILQQCFSAVSVAPVVCLAIAWYLLMRS